MQHPRCVNPSRAWALQPGRDVRLPGRLWQPVHGSLRAPSWGESGTRGRRRGQGPASPTHLCKTGLGLQVSSDSGIPTQGLDFQIYEASMGTQKPPWAGTTDCSRTRTLGQNSSLWRSLLPSWGGGWMGLCCLHLPSNPEAKGPQWGRKLNGWDGTNICDPAPAEWPLPAARPGGGSAGQTSATGADAAPRSGCVFQQINMQGAPVHTWKLPGPLPRRATSGTAKP